MKTIYFILGFLVGILFFSCKKEDIKPGNYQPGTKDTTKTPPPVYTNGGTIPTFSNPSTEVVGTKWVLTKVVTAFATSYPNDTLTFDDMDNYHLNSNAKRQYSLTSGVASTNKTLTLYYFYPFGGSHYAGEVGYYFVTDSVMNNIEFHNIQNTTDKIKAWFTRIQ